MKVIIFLKLIYLGSNIKDGVHNIQSNQDNQFFNDDEDINKNGNDGFLFKNKKMKDFVRQAKQLIWNEEIKSFVK